MNVVGLLGYNILTGIATIALVTLGLGIIYGMMRVINLAHGEFMMLGAYTFMIANDAGFNIWISMLVLPPLTVGVFGMIIERTVIRFLYGRMLDTMLATWGLSLGLTGSIATIYGNGVRSVPSPVGSFSIGAYSVSGFGLVIVIIAVLLFAGLYIALRTTRFGLILRATMERPDTAAALGVRPATVYLATFALGSAMAGLAGGVLAPLSGISPTMGGAYIVSAFITVLTAGAAVITGTGIAATLFGTIEGITAFRAGPVVANLVLLTTAVVLIRILPTGITGTFWRRSL
ncbi:branched-chain amino acid ABC transporter permease [Mesorhizobium sp. M7A.F.Ca.US.006.01.1.1]|uniref:branched-chain amino acid ABC transporter permease n=1 Tax=Mesorhizobium sp. M7A.F.Ca.US.006.01.1.1 TaxID=2496707 RepID=UPI000FC9F384|nr:branched-chain amino acid ABC transporter permease [Mesorhizobium sp. M7A.F.Ca.US.006.01.1.1]RUZ72656.1 branched-chain amino acid ABC transporter permease [Mesorhizobium sp. M7A.F.Ca.US.006.01.1.1]